MNNFGVRQQKISPVGDIVKRSSQFHSDARELQPTPLADGKFKLAPVLEEILIFGGVYSFVLGILVSSTRHREEFRHEVPASGLQRKRRGGGDTAR